MTKLLNAILAFFSATSLFCAEGALLTPYEAGIRSLISLYSDREDLLSVGSGKNGGRSGVPTRSIGFGGFIMETMKESGHVVHLSIPPQIWSVPGVKITDPELIKAEIERWKMPQSLGYPEFVKFDKPSPGNITLSDRMCVLPRVCNAGIFFDEAMSYRFYSDKAGKRLSIGGVMINASLMNPDETQFPPVTEQTSIDDVRSAFEAAISGGPYSDASLLMESIKIDQECKIAHENSYFATLLAGFESNHKAALRRVRVVQLTFLIKGVEKRTMSALIDPLTKAIVAGYTIF